MDTKTIMGTITFIHHEKKYATIEYIQNGKKKSINGNVDEKEQLRLKQQKTIKKTHVFRIGDEVSFIIVPSPKGDRMIADNIEFRFNNAYTNIINKAAVENKFVGYLKKVGDDYFVKESGSYILFPLILSPWEMVPHESRHNEPLFFKLDNTDKVNAVTASLYKSEFIREYQTALRHFKNDEPIDAVVNKVTPYGIFLDLVGDKIQTKMAVAKNDAVANDIKTGDIIKVHITYISPLKIVVEELK
jgi:ribosomal protein S1